MACSDDALARGVVFNHTELMNSCQDFFRNRLEKAKAMFDAEGINVNAVIENGDPAGVIIDNVKTKGFEKVIMGTRGLSKLKELVLGSVSSKVLSNIDVPVTFIH